MTYAAVTIFTWFSLLHSAIAPDQLLDAATRYKLLAIGIVDRATTLAHARLAQAARATPVHVVYGTTLRMQDGYVLRALARDDVGYQNVCRLISAQATGAALPYDMVRAQRDGLYLLCGGRQGHLWHLVQQGDGGARCGHWLACRRWPTAPITFSWSASSTILTPPLTSAPGKPC